jgi:HK97 family phage major capsid protein
VIHENRLLDRLPTTAMAGPSIEYVRHTGTTGAPTIVAERQQKPELVFSVDHVVATAKKLACHVGVSWEAMNDYSSFISYVQSEAFSQVVDSENDLLLNGDGSPGDGLLAAAGITHNAGLDNASLETALDSVEKGIAAMRVGSALSTPTLFVTNPTTWSALRRIKDTLGRFIVSPDPTRDAASTIFGVEVLVTTVCDEGVGLLIDTAKFGRCLVRESLSMRTGTDSGDFTKNIVRFVFEERLTAAIERPSALCRIANLPVEGS